VSEEQRARDAQLDLVAWAELPEKTRLDLSYKVTNTGKYPVWIFNKLHSSIKFGRGRELDPNLVNVEFDPQQFLLTLSKKVSQVPESMSVEAPISPCVTLLEPGQECEEALHVVLPLRFRSDYVNVSDESLVSTSIEAPWVFELGYGILIVPGARAMMREAQTTDGTKAWSVVPMTYGTQDLLRTPAFGLKIPYFRRKPDVP
jgi:hypothetical protein